ncbi:MAG: hypothetical protein H6753_05680 [Candidatus Omnitrophica bacterium]|nr:hypothetical protein [Candidatus Omnitrophota bacterium]
MHKYIIAIVIVCGVWFFSTNACAQVMIEQGKVIIKANPGETIVNKLPIHNTSGTNSINLRAYWEDFIYTAPFAGEKDFMAAGTSEYSASRWINFSPQQFTLQSKGSQMISYSIQVPVDAKGGYYGVLFLEEGGGNPDGNIGVSVVTRVGALFFIEITNSVRKCKIEHLKYADKKFSGDFTNLGDVILIPDSTYYILDQEGLVAERGEIKKFYLPPQKTAAFDVEIGEKLPVGKFTAVLTFDFGASENFTYEFDFEKTDDKMIIMSKTTS